MNLDKKTLRRDTRVFISAVTRDLGSVRTLVKKALEDNDYHAVEQDNFPPDYRDLVDKLRARIASCDAVIHIAGHCYGAEPPQLPDDQARRSYTQLEYELARELDKPVYVFLTGKDFPAEPHEPEDDERVQLQAAHRRRLAGVGIDYNPIESREALDQKIRSLQLKVESLQQELTQVDTNVVATGRRLSQRFAIGASLLVVLSGGIVWSVSQLRREVPEKIEQVQQQTVDQIQQAQQETVEQIETAQEETVRSLTDPAALAETIRKQIRATAGQKIEALPDEQGRGRMIAEIERERDVALGRVDDLIQLIQEGLRKGASPVFQRASEILQTEGTDEAIAYLESSRPSTIETARRHAEQAKMAQARAEAEKEQRNKTLQALVLEAELLETKLQWQPALELRVQVAELAPDWFDARNHLGMLLDRLARYDAAEPHERAALSLAANPNQEAIALNNLAQLLKETNRLAEAESMMRRGLTIEKQTYGSEHPHVAIQLNNLAQLLQDTNRLAEAEPLYRRALAIDEQFYGAKHPNVARELNNLAGLLQETNRLAEAEPMRRRALAIDEQSYGAQHPRVATLLNNLASLLHATNRQAEAEPLYRRALAIDEQSYGAQHPDVARDLNNLASLLQATNRLAEAEPLYRRALAFDKQTYGAQHPRVATKLNNLAQLLKSTNRLVKAEPLMRRALAIDEQSYGPKHPKVAKGLNNLALLLLDTNRLVEAEPIMRRALAIDEQSYGAEHPDVAIRLNNLALLLHDTNRLAEAEPLMRRGLAIGEQSFGAEHPKVAGELNNLASLLQETNRLAEAEPLYRRVLAISEQSYGAEHPKVAIGLNNLARLLQATNRLAEAEPLMRRCVIIFSQFGLRTGHNHPGMQTVLGNYREILQDTELAEGDIDQRLKSTAEVAEPLEPIVPEVERLLGPAQPVANVLATLDRQYKIDGKPGVYFLSPDQPMAPHLDELLKPTPESMNAAGVNAYRYGDHADAILHYEESLKLLEVNPEDEQATEFMVHMNRAAALRELGDVEQARDELRGMLSGLGTGDEISAVANGRARYHLAMCEWRLGDRDAALREAEESLIAYGEEAEDSPLEEETMQLLADLKDNKPPPPLAVVDTSAALESARVRFRARAEMAKVPIDQPAAVLLDQMLGPARSTEEVFESLDQQYREQGKPAVWFLPLTEPIAPHLDDLLGPAQEPL